MAPDTAVLSCEACRQRKIKCDRGQPCGTCRKLLLKCVQPPRVARPTKNKPRSRNVELMSRVGRLENLVRSLEFEKASLGGGSPAFTTSMNVVSQEESWTQEQSSSPALSNQRVKAEGGRMPQAPSPRVLLEGDIWSALSGEVTHPELQVYLSEPRSR